MLKKITIENINSIGRCELDFKKKSYKFLEDNILEDLVNPIALYGHNGSGKSAVLKAIQNLIYLMTLPIDNLMPFVVNNFLYEEFAADVQNGKKADKNKLIGKICLEFTLNDLEFTYFLSTSRFDNSIPLEYLKCNQEDVFIRKNQTEIIGEKKYIIQNRSLLLPSLRSLASSEVNNDKIQLAFAFVSSFAFVDLPRQHAITGFVSSKSLIGISTLDLLVNKSLEVKEILKNYKEFPIYDIVKKESTQNTNGLPQSGYYLAFEGKQDSLLPIQMISDGMMNQSVLLSILLSLPENTVLFIDELEQALHPTAMISFLGVIKEKKFQLVFTSHNTHILQHLRPDQIYFAKWKNGFSEYKRLANIYPNIREINNIEKMYLANVFDYEE